MIARSAVYYAQPALIVFLLVLMAGIAFALLLPAKYRSEARLLTLPADYYAVRGQDKSANDSAEAFKPEQLTNVEMQLLSSEDLQRDVVQQSGIAANDVAALEKARRAFAKNLTIQRVDVANVIELGFSAGTPLEASTQLQKLLDVYFATRARVLTSGRATLVGQQRDVAARELDAADTALRSFQERNGIVDIAGQVGGAIAVDTALRQDMASTRADLSQTQGNGSHLRSGSARIPRNVELYRDDTEATKAIADMQSQILALEAKRADLQGRYMQDSPLITQVDKQIGGLRTAINKQSGQLRAARRTGRNSYYDAANDRILQSDAAASGQLAKLGRLDQELSESGLRLRNLNEVAAIIARLKTQRDVAEERFRGLTTQLEDARARELEATTGSTNVRIIQRPSLPNGPSRSLAMLVAGSLLVALLLAGATLFVLILRRKTYLDQAEVKAGLNLPFVIDMTRAGKQGAGRATQLPALLQNRLGVGGNGRVIALVAAEPESYGKEVAHLVRLIETQSAGPVATVTFEDAAYQMSGDALNRLVPGHGSGARIKVGSVAWTIDQTGERLLASLRDAARWTILLVPPVDAASLDDLQETRGLEAAALADDILLVVRTEVTGRSAAENIAAALQGMNATIKGAVLTGRRIRWPRFIRSFG